MLSPVSVHIRETVQELTNVTSKALGWRSLIEMLHIHAINPQLCSAIARRLALLCRKGRVGLSG